MRAAVVAAVALGGLAVVGAGARVGAGANVGATGSSSSITTSIASPAAATSPASAPSGDGALALHPCRLAGLEHDALCGTLQRPLDPARPGSTRIGLQVAVLPALARNKQPDPVFFLAGGPGQGAIGLAGVVSQLLARVGDRRDIVLVDQRGTGRSAPLKCDAPTAQEGLARALDRRAEFAAMDACRAALQRLPWGDLRFYTTSLAMADADAVRAALGAERIDLVGGSYGTRAALEYLRAYPRHVRRVVLDGVAPPDMVLPESSELDGRAVLDAGLRACAAEPACARAHPGLGAAWERLLASMPRTVDAADPATGRPLRLAMTRDAVLDLVRPALYSPATGAVLPAVVEAAAGGDFAPLLALGASQDGLGPDSIAEGEHFSVVCAEDAPRMAPVAPDDPASAAGTAGRYRQVCAHWPRGDVPPAFYTIPPARVPVLLLSGGLDPVTPPRHAERVARALGPLARSVVVANAGHGVGALPCMRDAVFHFIDADEPQAALAVDVNCAATLPRPPAFRPPRPARAASADNDPRGYGEADERPRRRSRAASAAGDVDAPAHPPATRGAAR